MSKVSCINTTVGLDKRDVKTFKADIKTGASPEDVVEMLISDAMAEHSSLLSVIREEGGKVEGYTKPVEVVEQEVKTRPRQAPSSKPSSNTIFTDDAAAKARAILKSKLGQLNSGFDPEIMNAGLTLAGYHIEKGVRKFSALAQAIADDLGVSIATIKPYLRSWYNGARDVLEDSGESVEDMDSPEQVKKTLKTLSEAADVERTAGNQEPDSGNREDGSPAVESDLFDDGRGEVRSGDSKTGAKAGEARQKASDAVGDSRTATTGKRSDKPVNAEESGLGNAPPRSIDDTGGTGDSTGRLLADARPDGEISNSIEKAPVATPKIKAGKRTVAPADISQIQEQMPFLSDGQAEDVAIAETRFAKPDGYGMLFTNGTGTGKTFVGLGVARRAVDSGKKNILIVAPKQPILTAWAGAGKGFFNLAITTLKDTNDAGKGVVATTYANLGDNPALLRRDWDLIITDESQYLSSSADGKETKALTAVRAMTLKEGSGMHRARAKNPKWVAELNALNDKWDKDKRPGARQEIEKEISAVAKKLREKAKEQEKLIADTKPEDKPRMLMLSATPFAYEKNVALAQGYLFDWGSDADNLSYNSGDNYERFMMEKFGYRMRYNKLTAPEADVDRGLMQREFNAWLKSEGVLSGRLLESEFDYDRKFIMTENAIGRRVDDALKWLQESEIEGVEVLTEKIKDSFNYHARLYFLEALKAREVVPIIKQHLALGRNVLVMHDLKKGGTANPFKFTSIADKGKVALAAFNAEFKGLIDSFEILASPIQHLSSEFPDAIIYNGNVTGKKRVGLQNEFNDDTDGTPRLIVAQSDSMREGVSVHDTTGKHQRVLLNLGLPVKPTATIQQEGRIYRTGQATDALFRYLTIGTNWERWAFATTIAQRAGTAENLAMGEKARGLKESFIQAYEEADTYPPGFDGEGKGGKEADNALANTLTEWDKAKAYYFGTKKQGKGRSAKGRENSEYFATPEPIGLKMVEWADLKPGDRALEPSAGHGAIARWLSEATENRAIEYESELSSKLALRFSGDVQTGDFMQHHAVNKYNAIIMNPPFGAGGKQAAEHVEKAMLHLKDRGRIVALIPDGGMADKRFEKLLSSDKAEGIYTVAEIKLPSVTFKRAGTGVRTKVIVLEKQGNSEAAQKLSQRNADFTSTEEIKELFDSLEDYNLDPINRDVEEEQTASVELVDQDFTISSMDSVHTKKGHDLFVVNIDGDMGDNYQSMADAAKANDGAYIKARFRSWYKPKDGGEITGKPTFFFTEKADRDSFIASVKGSTNTEGDISFSREAKLPTNTKPKGINPKIAQAISNKFLKKYSGASGVQIDIYATQAQAFGPKSRDTHGKVKAGYNTETDTVYIVAENMESVQDLQATLQHEILAHKGLGFFAEKDIAKLLEAIEEAAPKSKVLAPIWAKVQKDYAGESKTVMAEELFARVSEAKMGIVDKYWTKIATAVRNLLRKAGWTSDISYTDMRGMIYNMGDAFTQGKTARQRSTQKQGDSNERDDRTDGGKTDSQSQEESYTSLIEAANPDSETLESSGAINDLEQGREITVLHRSDAKFDTFDDSYLGANSKHSTSLLGHFSSLSDVGFNKTYGKNLTTHKVQLKNVLTVSEGDFSDMVALSDDEVNATRKALMDAGIDGIAVLGLDWVVVFEGKNLTKDDTKFSREEDNPTGFSAPDETLATIAIRKMQDKFKVLKDLQSNITGAGGKITETTDAYMAEELFHGKAENDLRIMRDDYVKPLADLMGKSNITHKEFDEYLTAKHAPERNKQVASINPDMPDGGSGMTNAKSREVLSNIEGDGRSKEFAKAAGYVYQMLQYQRDTIRAEGLEDDGLIDAWENSYQYYVPLKGWADDTKEEGKPGTGQGFNIGGRESKRALGRKSEAASPSSYAIADLTKTLIRGRKNEVGNALLGMIQANENKEYWEVFTDENPETDRRIVKRKNPETGKVEEVVTETVVPMAMFRDQYFTTKKDGKTHYMKLKDERLMIAMKNLGIDQGGALIRSLGAVNRVLSALNTSYNPNFIVGNFLKDIQTALLNINAEQSREDGKLQGVSITKQTAKDVPIAMRAIYANLRGKKLKGKGAEWQKHFDDFREHGAKTGWFDMKDLDGLSSELDGLVKQAQGGIKGAMHAFYHDSAEVVENVNQAVENAVRLSAYINAVKAGISKPKAASMAKNMTVNFNRKGELGTTLNALYMFSNASIQGVSNFARTMYGLNGEKGDPTWNRLNNAQKIAVGIVAGSYALSVLNRMSAGEDDDGENWYDKVPAYEKERNLVIMKSVFGGEEGEYWKIPLPYGYNVFYILGSSAEAVQNDPSKIAKQSGDLVLAGLGSFSPIGFQDSDSLHGLFLKNAAPTIVKPVVEIALNENFFGSSVYNENFPFGTQKPDSALARRSSPELYKGAATWMNKVTGGSDYRSGAIDVNPDVFRHFVNFYGGGAFGFVADKVVDNVVKLSQGVEVEARRLPFLGRITGEVMPYADRDAYYDRRGEIAQVVAEYKTLSGDERSKFSREYGSLVRMNSLVKRSDKQLKLLRKQTTHIYKMDISAAERDRKLKAINLKIKAVIDRFNKTYNEAA